MNNVADVENECIFIKILFINFPIYFKPPGFNSYILNAKFLIIFSCRGSCGF